MTQNMVQVLTGPSKIRNKYVEQEHCFLSENIAVHLFEVIIFNYRGHYYTHGTCKFSTKFYTQLTMKPDQNSIVTT